MMKRADLPLVILPESGCEWDLVIRQAVVEALEMSGWVKKDAAELLRTSPTRLQYRIDTLGISRPDNRSWRHGGDRRSQAYKTMRVVRDETTERLVNALRYYTRADRQQQVLF